MKLLKKTLVSLYLALPFILPLFGDMFGCGETHYGRLLIYYSAVAFIIIPTSGWILRGIAVILVALFSPETVERWDHQEVEKERQKKEKEAREEWGKRAVGRERYERYNILRSRVRRRAEHIWWLWGSPQGRDEEIWREAETELCDRVHSLIAERAQQIWQASGCPQGRDEEIWLEADFQVWFYDWSRRDEASISQPPLGYPQESGWCPPPQKQKITVCYEEPHVVSWLD